ncbi:MULTISPECIES: choice-of-anchor J domain-containing protein [unclassified Carboxylicivirga]|uniref:choice-of-anchor J domain-containing protein n=1 Tax=Carboxylicivirga TaxID=1628153 RepID=UPI003D326FF8
MKNFRKLAIAIGCLVMTINAMAQDAKTLPYKAAWATDLEDWQVIDNKYQSKTWQWKSAETLTITDSKRANDDWLISPAINCSGKGAKKVWLNAAWNKAQSSNISLYYSTNFEGNVEAAEWILIEENIIPDSHPFGFKWAAYYTYSKKLKFSAPKVHFAIRYQPHNEAGERQNEIRIRRFKVLGK